MSEFLVEAYVPRTGARVTAPDLDDVSHAADELTREGTPVRLLRSIFVPEDETCFYLYQALSVDAVREAATRAGLKLERVSAAVSDTTAPAAFPAASRTPTEEEPS